MQGPRHGSKGPDGAAPRTFDGRGAHVLEAVQGVAVLDALFTGDDAARARFDAKREEFCAAELRRAVCDACGVGR